MPPFVNTMSNQALVVEMFAEDLRQQYEVPGDRVSELLDEIGRRYGTEAPDRLADHVTGHKMTPIESIVWSATSFPDVEAILNGSSVRPGQVGWLVIRQNPGMPLSEDDPRRSGYNMVPCPLQECANAITSVREDQLFTASSITEAFTLATRNHPGSDMAAYIVDHGDGSYTVAV